MKFSLLLAGLFFFQQLCLAQSCRSSVEALQKKIITQHIHKYPLSYGKDVSIMKIETLDCTDRGINRYLVYYNDTVCYDFSDSTKEILRCNRVKCHSPAQVTALGNVDFDLAAVKNCQR